MCKNLKKTWRYVGWKKRDEQVKVKTFGILIRDINNCFLPKPCN